MSMQELPDDRLDELFRKSSEEFEPTFEPKAWEAMRRKLDDEDKKPGAWWWRRVGVIGSILLFLGLGTFLIWPNKSETVTFLPKKETIKEVYQQPKRPSTETTASQKINQEAHSSEPEKALVEEEEVKANPNEDESPHQALGEKQKVQLTQIQQAKNQSISSAKENSSTLEVAEGRLVARKKIREAVSTPSHERDQENRWVNTLKSTKSKGVKPRKVISTASTYRPFLDRKKEVTHNSAVLVGEKETAPESMSSSSSNEPQWPTMLNVKLQEMVAKNWKLLTVVVAHPRVEYFPPAPPPIVKKKESAEPPVAFQKGLSTRVMSTPDLSFISSSEMLKNPRLALSIMLEYRFARRWSIQMGAIKSNKVYTATGEQYKWPEIWNSQKARPTEVAASCKVLDIPINIRFDVVEGRRSRWFVSSGVSSYKMIKERYDYTYPPHSYPKWLNWEGSTGNYWLGVLNASVGVERQIGRNFTLQVEPFWKVPMAEVGFGKIRLQTSGFFISAKYRLPRTGF